MPASSLVQLLDFFFSSGLFDRVSIWARHLKNARSGITTRRSLDDIHIIIALEVDDRIDQASLHLPQSSLESRDLEAIAVADRLDTMELIAVHGTTYKPYATDTTTSVCDRATSALIPRDAFPLHQFN